MIVVKIILIGTFLSMLYQDVKDREIDMLYPLLIAISGFYLNLQSNYLIELVYITLLNLCFLALYMVLGFLVVRHVLKIKAKNSMGSGDILLFTALAFCFPTGTFIVLFIFSLLFSLGLHFLTRHKSHYKTIPLAGLMSAFFGLAYISYWLGFAPNLYLI